MISVVLFLIALALAPIIAGGFGELKLGIIEVLVLSAFVSHVITFCADCNRWTKVPGVVALGIFFGWVLLASFFTESVYFSFTHIIYAATALAGYLLGAALSRDSKVAGGIVWIIVAVTFGICLFGIRGYAIASGGGAQFWAVLFGSGDHDRLFGTFLNPAFFSGYLVLALPVTLGTYLVTRRLALVVLAGLTFAVEVISLMLTGTKFGLISAFFAFMVMFAALLLSKSMARVQWKRFAVIAVIGIALAIVFSGPMLGRFQEAQAGGSQVHSTVFRIYTWKATLNMVQDNPIFGVGPGVFDIAYPRYSIAGPTKHAHQSYLQIAAESGVVALVALVAALLVMMWRASFAIIKNSRRQNGDSPALCAEAMAADDQPFDWSDLIPENCWPIVNCAILGALAGSAARNLVDSDWFILGIVLPFAALAGVLVTRSGAATGEVQLRWSKGVIVTISVILILLAISFAVGDYFAKYRGEMPDYELAANVSPLNPEYKRELAKIYAVTDGWHDRAMRTVRRAIALAPTDGQNYYAAGMIAATLGDLTAAIDYFQTALRYNPYSTQTLQQLAHIYKQRGDLGEYEDVMTRLLEQEKSTYESVKGAPELVDTSYAYAHVYFGRKYLDSKDYVDALKHFRASVDRLEDWRSDPQILEVLRYSGALTKEKERDLLILLRDSYYGMAQSYSGLGKDEKAAEAKEHAVAIQQELTSE